MMRIKKILFKDIAVNILWMKVILKPVKETENMSLKNSAIFREWLSNARSRYKHIKNKDLLQQFDKWVHKQCGIIK